MIVNPPDNISGIKTTGQPNITGDVELKAGTGTSLSQAGQAITISSTVAPVTVAKSGGSPALTGNVTLTGGTNVSLNQVGQDISISASDPAASALATTTAPVVVSGSAAPSGAGQVLTTTGVSSASWQTPSTPVTSFGKQGGTAWTGDVTLSGGTNITITPQSGNNLAISSSVSDFTGDTGTGGVHGLVPAPAAGDATKFLRGDKSWQTVTSGVSSIRKAGDALLTGAVTLTGGTGITLTQAAQDISIAQSVPAWTTYEIDFTSLATDPVGAKWSDGNVTIDGKTWVVANSAQASTFKILNGTGLQIYGGNASDYFNGTRTCPIVTIPLSTLLPGLDLTYHTLVIEAYITFASSPSNTYGTGFAIEQLAAPLTRNVTSLMQRIGGSNEFRFKTGTNSASSEYGVARSTNNTATMVISPGGHGIWSYVVSAQSIYNSGWGNVPPENIVRDGYQSGVQLSNPLNYQLSLYSFDLAGNQVQGIINRLRLRYR